MSGRRKCLRPGANKLREYKQRNLEMSKSRNANNIEAASVSSPGGFKPNDSEDEETQLHPSKEEQDIADAFLNKFLIQSEASSDGHIDLGLVLKAIPNKIKEYQMERVELFNFKIFQDSLIAHQNTEIVDAFENFDQRNKDRVYSIKEKLLGQKKELKSIRDILASVQTTNHPRAASAGGDLHSPLRKKDLQVSSQKKGSNRKRPGLRKMSSNDDINRGDGESD